MTSQRKRSLLPRWMGSLHFWTWLAVVSALGVCGAISWLHSQEHQTLVRAQQMLDTIHEARIDLSKGFLDVLLGAEDPTDSSRERGIALLHQAVRGLQESSDWANEVVEEDRITRNRFEAESKLFFELLEAWRESGGGRPSAAEVEMRVAFHQIERQAERIDAAAVEALQALVEQSNRRFQYASLVAAMLLGGFCAGVYASGLNERRALASLQARESQLQESAMLYQSLLENLPQRIFRKDLSGRYSFANEHFCASLNRPLREVIGRSDADFFPPEQAASYQGGDAQVIATGEKLETEDVFPQPDGTRGIVHTVKTPLRNGEGRIIGVQGIFWDISERKRAEAELRHRLELQDQLAKTAAVVPGLLYTFELRPDGAVRLPYAGEGLDHMFGLGFEDVRDDARKLFAVTHPEDRQRIEESVLVSARNFMPWQEEFRVQNPERGLRWIEGNAKPQLGPNGSVIWHGFLQDITERKRADLALRVSEERLQLALAGSQMGVWEWDLATGRVYSSPESLRLLGLAEHEPSFSFEKFKELLHPEDRDGALELVQKSLAEQATFNAEFRLLLPGGPVIWIAYQGRCICNSSGQPVRVIGTVQDITARRQSEEERNRLVIAMEQSVESIVITDVAGHILYVNPAFEKTSGYSRAEALGKNPRLLRSDRHDAAFYQAMWKTLAAGEVWHGQLINRRKDGSLYEEDATISPVRNASGKVVNYVAIKLDITRQVALEAQLRQSQKMEAIGQLAGGVAHDFNNILAVILLQAELAERTPNLPVEAERGFKEIRNAATRAANLVRQLLLFSRKQVMQARDLNLNESILSLAKMLQRIIGEDVQLHFHLSPSPALVHADGGMVDQLLLNLAVNARDAMPDGGTLLIETSELRLPPGAPRPHPDATDSRYFCIKVTDSGTGISPEVLPRIFEPFFTTKQPGKGTGLGLATVFGIMKQHRGWITATNAPGGGARFEVGFPALQGDATLDVQGVPAVPRGGTEMILLVEDDPGLRIAARSLLEHYGYQVVEAASAVDAMRMWPDIYQRVALLLTDLVMPGGVGGQQLARQLHAAKPDLKITYMSGYSPNIAGRELQLHAHERFLRKPFAPDELLATVRQSLDG